MLTRSRNVVRSAAIGVGAALLATLGCGGGDGVKTYPVNGKVVYKGPGDVAKLEGSGVHLESVSEPKVTAGGDIGPDGSFTVWCYLEGKDRQGVPAGEYRVCIRPARSDDEGPRRIPIHPRYQSFDKSGLTVTVAAGTNTPTIEVEAAK